MSVLDYDAAVNRDGADAARYNAADILSLGGVAVLLCLTAVCRRQLDAGEAAWLCAQYCALGLLIVASAALASRGSVYRVLHDFSPVVTIICVFNSLGPLIHTVNPVLWDARFAALDARWLAPLAVSWPQVLGRPSWLTDAAYVAYVLYYPLPVALAVLLYARGSADGFRAFVFAVLTTFFASYLGYFLCPTLGPRVPPELEATLLGGGAISGGIRLFLHFVERTQTDAFPSGHTAVALVSLSCAWHRSRRAFAVCTPVVAGIIFSTVYLHYHYASDVIAGIALAAGCLWLAPRLQPACAPREWISLVAAMRNVIR